MVRKDYLLRVIEQFAAFLEKIFFHKLAGDYASAELQIDATVKTLLGVDPESLYAMSVEKILEDLVGGSKFDVDLCLVIAELYNQKAEVARATDPDPDRRYFDCLEKAFLLYTEAVKHGADNVAYRDKIITIATALRRHELADDTKLRLLWYYELCGLFAKAEDVLYELADSGMDGIKNIGMEFYKRLNDKEDVLLAVGNLPRQEVEEGYRHFSTLSEPEMEK